MRRGSRVRLSVAPESERRRVKIIGWNFDDTENPDAWGHAPVSTIGFHDCLAICWDQWRECVGYFRTDGPKARKDWADCARALRALSGADYDGLDRIIGEYGALEGCDDYRGPAYHEQQSDRGADVWRTEQALVDTGQAHREPAASCGCIDWPCCGCDGYVLAEGAA